MWKYFLKTKLNLNFSKYQYRKEITDHFTMYYT